MWPLKRKKPKVSPPAAPKAPKARAQDIPEKEKVLKTLENTELSIDNTQEDGFDPYNSGVFDRSKIWESWQRRE